MIFNSIEFILFFILTFVIYYCVKDKYKYIIILLSSYFFYGYANIKYLILLFLITLISYLSGYYISKKNDKNTQKKIIVISVIVMLGLLTYFKYLNFVLGNINIIFNSNFNIANLVVPLGISFYILQAITYPIDIYRKDVNVEMNFLKFASFISFFPCILSGPIGKSKKMLPQFSLNHAFNYDEVKKGLLYVLYGFFQKLVIADCMSIGINNVYGNLHEFSGLPLLVVVLFYSFQIYFDFASYSNIAYGCAKMLGYDVIKNFNSPYFADSIKNFWARWHISLSTWFKEYLYIPLGGNRKGKIITYINLLIVFIASGLWHGAAWTYIIWGIIHGMYQVLERIFKYKCKLKIINIFITFILVTFAWIFFRSNNLNDAIYVIINMFKIDFNHILTQLLTIGLDKFDYIIIIVSMIFVFTLEIINTKYNVIEYFNKLNVVIRWTIYFVIIFSILIFGCYGPGFDNSQFIYLGY